MMTCFLVVLDIFQLHLTLRFVCQRRLTLDLFKRGDVSSNWNLSFLSATKYDIFCPEIFFTFKLTNSAYHDKCRMKAFHQFTSVKNMYQKIYFTIEMQPNIFLKLFLVPFMYALTGCNLQVGKFNVSASNIIISASNISQRLG